MTTTGLVIGHRTDSAVRHVLEAARDSSMAVAFLDLGALAAGGAIRDAASPAAVVEVAGRRFPLARYRAVYQRIYAGVNAPASVRSRLVALETSLSLLKADVINRPTSGWQNTSKPLQMLMLAEGGFTVPPSRSTGIPADYHRFRAEEGDLIYKSNSGQRSIVERVTADHDRRARRLAKCPALFQRRIAGEDARVHVLGNETFGVRIESDTVDYRYSRWKGSVPRQRPEPALPADVEQRCITFARASDVVLAGFDFKIDGNGQWFCLEMNPAPAFESYDRVLGGIIARRLLQRLSA